MIDLFKTSRRRRWFAFLLNVGLLGALIAASPNILPSFFDHMRRARITVLEERQRWVDLISPDAGFERSHPEEVIIARAIVRQFRLGDYRTLTIDRHSAIFQRLVEGLLPVRHSANSNNLLTYRNESLPAGCAPVISIGKVTYATCALD